MSSLTTDAGEGAPTTAAPAATEVTLGAIRRHRGMISEALTKPMASYYLVLVSTTILTAIGLVMVLSSSSVLATVNEGSPYGDFFKQARILAIGIPLVFVLSRCNEKTLKWLGWAGMLFALLLLVLVVIPGGPGREYYGNRAWLVIGGFQLQPSEFAKAAVVVWSAAVLAARTRTLDQVKRMLIPFLPVNLLVLALVVLEKDLGTAVIIAGLILLMLWFVGAPMKIIGALTAAGVLAVGLLVITEPERMARIFGFFGADGGSTSDQPLNAIYAFATGGWFGVGLGASRQKWGGLYNGASTDYILAVIGEELGLLGTLLVLALFCVLGYAGLRIALRSDSLFRRVAAGGMTAWLMMQAVVNIFVALKLLPVIGVPLPFISAGGSALLANLIAVGVLLSCARQEPAARAARAARTEAKPRVTGVVAAS